MPNNPWVVARRKALKDLKAKDTQKSVQDLMTINEVAKYLNFKPRTIHNWVQKNLIPHYRLGRKTIRFDMETIDEWLETKRQGDALQRSKIFKTDDLIVNIQSKQELL